MASLNHPHDNAVRAHANATYAKPEDTEPLAVKAERYINENRKVYQMFCHFTWEAVMAGKTRIGARMVWERMRWESEVRGNDDYKLNNNYVPFFARRFQSDYPEAGTIFNTRGGKHVTPQDTGDIKPR